MTPDHHAPRRSATVSPRPRSGHLPARRGRPAGWSAGAVDHAHGAEGARPPSRRTCSRSSCRGRRKRICRTALHLMVLEDHHLPQITFQIIIPGAGGYFDPADKSRVSPSYTAQLMREGTKTRTSPQISEALETMAATLTVGSGLAGASASVSGSALTEDFDKLMDLTADVPAEPGRSRPIEWDRLKTRTKAGLIQQRANPGFSRGGDVQPRCRSAPIRPAACRRRRRISTRSLPGSAGRLSQDALRARSCRHRVRR